MLRPERFSKTPKRADTPTEKLKFLPPSHARTPPSSTLGNSVGLKPRGKRAYLGASGGMLSPPLSRHRSPALPPAAEPGEAPFVFGAFLERTPRGLRGHKKPPQPR